MPFMATNGHLRSNPVREAVPNISTTGGIWDAALYPLATSEADSHKR
jgi:hypothetical protein